MSRSLVVVVPVTNMCLPRKVGQRQKNALKLIPWRIDLVDPPAKHLVWHAPQEQS